MAMRMAKVLLVGMTRDPGQKTQEAAGPSFKFSFRLVDSMPTPGEHKTAQARILAYAEVIVWTIVSREKPKGGEGSRQ